MNSAIENQKIVQFLKQMTEADRKALRIDQLSGKLWWLSQTKWGVLISTLGDGSGISTAAYKLLIADRRAQIACADQSAEIFKTCLNDFLVHKYGDDFKLTDPRVVANTNALIAEHNKSLLEANRKKNRSTRLDQMQGKLDMSTPFYQEHLMDLNEKAFDEELLHSYLPFLHPGEAAVNSIALTQILSEKQDSPAQRIKIDDLTKDSPNLAQDLRRLIAHKRGGQVASKLGN